MGSITTAQSRAEVYCSLLVLVYMVEIPQRTSIHPPGFWDTSRRVYTMSVTFSYWQICCVMIWISYSDVNSGKGQLKPGATGTLLLLHGFPTSSYDWVKVNIIQHLHQLDKIFISGFPWYILGFSWHLSGFSWHFHCLLLVLRLRW